MCRIATQNLRWKRVEKQIKKVQALPFSMLSTQTDLSLALASFEEKKKTHRCTFFSPDVVVKLFLLLQLLGWLLLQLLLHATPLAAAPNFYNFHPFSANLIITTTVFQKALWKLRRPRKIENALFPLRLNSSKNGKLSPWKSANSTEFIENNIPHNLLE